VKATTRHSRNPVWLGTIVHGCIEVGDVVAPVAVERAIEALPWSRPLHAVNSCSVGAPCTRFLSGVAWFHC